MSHFQFLVGLGVLALSFCRAGERPVYLNPVDCVTSPGDGRAFVALNGSRAVAVVDVAGRRLEATWQLAMPPSGLALSADASTLAVTIGETDGAVALLDTADGRERQHFGAGFSPCSPVFVGNVLAVCNRFTDSVGFYDPRDGTRLADVKVTREPVSAIASVDGSKLFVGCLLPAQAATTSHVATTVEVIDVATKQVATRILLPNGSTNLRGLALTPDGSTLFATHILGHHQVPTSQLERGWMNANALSVIDVASEKLLATALLDDISRGAANPWGVTVTEDAAYMVVAHHGTHEISRIPLEPFMQIVRRGRIDEAPRKTAYDGDLSRELRTMLVVGRARIRLAGEGPRALSTFGPLALVCEYFSGKLGVVDLSIEHAGSIRPAQVSLGPEPEMDVVRQGELRFHDARLCFQQWQSCMSCHPAIRTDGLNWDLLNDGIGNPKQTKSMLYAHETPPAMSLGVRDRAEDAVRAGIRHIQFAQVVEEEAASIDAFLKTLTPLPSPYLVNGALSNKAARGRVLYERIGCVRCHPAPYYTDLKSYLQHHATRVDASRKFDTPGLAEVWRTAPYLYDGRAATMKEALLVHDYGARGLSQEDLGALVEYVLSL